MKQFRKPDVIYKPKSPVGKLSDEDGEHMENIVNGGLMRSITPSHIEEQFVKQGYIYRATGGLMPTEAGHKALMFWKQTATAGLKE